LVLESLKGNLFRSGNRVYIYIPADISRDSAFPFKFKKGHVKVRIEPNRDCLIIEKIED